VKILNVVQEKEDGLCGNISKVNVYFEYINKSLKDKLIEWGERRISEKQIYEILK
jgi:hypothetical protein